MSIESNDIFEVANSLISLDSEAAWRSASSRTYYAAFHAAKYASANCTDNSHFKIEGGTHAILIDKFSSYRHPTNANIGKRIAYILQDMKRHREVCDYELEEDIKKSDVQTKMASYPRLLTLIQEAWSENNSIAS